MYRFFWVCVCVCWERLCQRIGIVNERKLKAKWTKATTKKKQIEWNSFDQCPPKTHKRISYFISVFYRSVCSLILLLWLWLWLCMHMYVCIILVCMRFHLNSELHEVIVNTAKYQSFFLYKSAKKKEKKTLTQRKKEWNRMREWKRWQ